MEYSRHLTISICTLFALFTCQSVDDDQVDRKNYRDEMVTFVRELNKSAQSMDSDFLVIAQNAEVLLTKNGKPGGQTNSSYLNAIDAISKESLFYGLEADNVATSEEARKYSMSFLDIAKKQGKTIMVVDYCSSQSKVRDSYQLNRNKGYISFAATERELDKIPLHPAPIIRENSLNIDALYDAKNFLYVLNPGKYTTKQDFLNAVNRTNYDMIVLDWVFHKGLPLSIADIKRLKTKPNGGKRLVIAYMSIGEAEDYRYYWKEEWNENRPGWIEKENPNWPGNYPVQYWTEEWKDLIYRSDSSYLAKLVEAGYDGVYLDRIDSFYHFEEQPGN